MVIGNCSNFTLSAFEFREFGLTNVFVETLQSDSTYEYRIYTNPDCTGDPYGFHVKASGMLISVCSLLTLPFISNEIGFAFYHTCQVCGANSTAPGFDTVTLPVTHTTLSTIKSSATKTAKMTATTAATAAPLPSC